MKSREFIFVLALVACVVLYLSKSRPPARDQVAITPVRPSQASLSVLVNGDLGDLESLKLEVECKSSELLEVGFRDDRPVAFYTLERQDNSSAIAGFVTRSYVDSLKRYSPPEIRAIDKLVVSLSSNDYSGSYGYEQLESDTNSPLVLSVYVWLDGDWREFRAVLGPTPDSDQVAVNRIEDGKLYPTGIDRLFKELLDSEGGSKMVPNGSPIRGDH
mgnify:CR=1 FL=1